MHKHPHTLVRTYNRDRDRLHAHAINASSQAFFLKPNVLLCFQLSLVYCHFFARFPELLVSPVFRHVNKDLLRWQVKTNTGARIFEETETGII